VGNFPGTNAKAGGGRKERDPGTVPEWQLVKSVEWIGLVRKRNKKKKEKEKKQRVGK